MSKKLRIFLGDITHDTIFLVSDTIPINIGFIASYIKKTYGDKVDITLFKYPNDIIEEIKSNPPDVIGLSNYSWNSNLSEFSMIFCPFLSSSFNLALSIVCSEILINSLLTNIS